MRLLIDTNVIIDVLAKRTGFYQDSLEVLHFCEVRKAEGFISATSVTDIMYILRKHLEPEFIQETIKTMLTVISVADVTKSDINTAFDLKMSDYEDAVQASCAKRIKADYIVTRNAKDFKNSPVKAITPTDLKLISSGR